MSHPITRQLTTQISYQVYGKCIYLPSSVLYKDYIHETCQLSIHVLSQDKQHVLSLDISGMVEGCALFS